MPVEIVKYSFGKIVDEIVTPIKIVNTVTGAFINTMALWDTGATDCAITENLINTLNLPVFSKARVISVHGMQRVNVHYIKFILENENISLKTPVTSCSELSEDGSIGFLIGMNLITKGDFLVSNFNGETTMIFRIPALNNLDFNLL